MTSEALLVLSLRDNMYITSICCFYTKRKRGREREGNFFIVVIYIYLEDEEEIQFMVLCNFG